MRRFVVKRKVGWASGSLPARAMASPYAAAEYSHVAARACRVVPCRWLGVVVEGRLAAHHELDHAADTSDRPKQDVFGVPVHRGASVGSRAGFDVVPWPH